MITLEEISLNQIAAFWDAHLHYLVQDGIVTDDEDLAYFQSAEYRQVIEAHMVRETDRHHLVYFMEDGKRIGAASYCTYQSEDGKCFVLDYWVFPAFRGHGMGHRCFDALMAHTQQRGAAYYEINCDGRDDRLRFWHSLGFVDHGIDNAGLPLLIHR